MPGVCCIGNYKELLRATNQSKRSLGASNSGGEL